MTADVLALVNRTGNTDLDAWLVGLAPALQHELQRFAADWSLRTPHVVVGDALGAWPIVFLLDADQAGALAYHDTDALGRPYSRVFVHDTRAAGVPLESAADHEAKEAMVDPDCLSASQKPNGTFVALEVCDPVQDGVLDHGMWQFSNYVLPAWFNPKAPGPYDRSHVLEQPLELTPGGYCIETDAAGQWQYVFGSGHAREAFAARADKQFVAARGVRRGARL